MASGFSLKDQLFNQEKTRYLAGLFAGASPDFQAEKFEKDVMAGLLERELKARISWIADILGTHLPGDLPEVAPILLQALPPPLDPGKNDDDFGDFIFAPLGEFVVARGLQDHPDLALDLLAAITQRFSMEWAIRPFLNAHQAKTLALMETWAKDPNYHLRRLVSEGTRPRLPWGQGVTLDLRDPLPLLDVLHADKTRYVTRSVANHLNDIAKKDPELVLDRLEYWHSLAQQDKKELDWLTSHACRGLIKAGYPRALLLLGFDPDAAIETALHLSANRTRIGEAFELSVDLTCAMPTKAIVDYRVTFHRPSGRLSQKVFKLKQLRVLPGGTTLHKKHQLKGDATTFKLYPGPHLVEILVNGRVRAKAEFDLIS